MRTLTLLLTMLGVITLSACGATKNTVDNQASVIETAVPIASEQVANTASPEPTEIATSSPSAEPEATAEVSKTTAKSNVTAKPVNTASPKPAKTAKPVNTEKPIETEKPSHIVKPAHTVKPVQTTKPSATAAATKKPQSVQHVVEIINFGFSPARIEIKVGDTVKFVNRDEIKHSATADNKSFNSELLGKDEAKVITFNKQGEFSYFCMPHPGMKGLIIVKAN